MIFRGIKLIKPIVIERNTDNKKELYFDNILPHDVREAWLRAGYPVYYCPVSNKSYTIADNVSWFDVMRDSEVKCDFGCSSVGSLKHHHQCSAYKGD